MLKLLTPRRDTDCGWTPTLALRIIRGVPVGWADARLVPPMMHPMKTIIFNDTGNYSEPTAVKVVAIV
jgi:hypothetical protein